MLIMEQADKKLYFNQNLALFLRQVINPWSSFSMFLIVVHFVLSINNLTFLTLWNYILSYLQYLVCNICRDQTLIVISNVDYRWNSNFFLNPWASYKLYISTCTWLWWTRVPFPNIYISWPKVSWVFVLCYGRTLSIM